MASTKSVTAAALGRQAVPGSRQSLLLASCRRCPSSRPVCTASLPQRVGSSTGHPEAPARARGGGQASSRPTAARRAAAVRMNMPEEGINAANARAAVRVGERSDQPLGVQPREVSPQAARLEAQVLEARLQSSSFTSTSYPGPGDEQPDPESDLVAFAAAMRTRTRDWYQGLMSIEQTFDDEWDGVVVDYGGRRAKAGMLFASVTSHSQQTHVASSSPPSPVTKTVDWDAVDDQPLDEEPSADTPVRKFSQEEREWRGIRDTLCFSIILALAGGPGPALDLLGAGVDASAMALRQAHTHPQIIFFTASLVPFLAFIWEVWACGRQTRGVTLAFASLLIFVVAGIPLESYTESTFGELVSNVDSVHFAAQSLVTATNLAIILSLQDSITAGQKSFDPEASNPGEPAPGVGLKADSSLLAAVTATAVAGAYALKHAGSQLVLHPSAGATVGDNALFPLLCVGIPTALGAGFLGLSSRLQAKVAGPGEGLNSGLQKCLWGGSALLVAAGLLAPTAGAEFAAEPSNALSLQTWSVHVISILEWSVAMALVWQYAGVSRQPAWKGLAWGMLPLHGSGLCAVVFHLWYNDPQLDWLISLQAFLTLSGNCTCWFAARRVRLAIDSASPPKVIGTDH